MLDAATRRGHTVSVFERVAKPGPVGAGITLQPTGQAALARLAPGTRLVATGDLFGHMIQCHLIAGAALAAAAVKAERISEAVVSNVGHVRGEGLVLIGRAN